MVVEIVHLSTSQAESKAIVVLFKLYSDHLYNVGYNIDMQSVARFVKNEKNALYPPCLRMMMMIVDGDGHIE